MALEVTVGATVNNDSTSAQCRQGGHTELAVAALGSGVPKIVGEIADCKIIGDCEFWGSRLIVPKSLVALDAGSKEFLCQVDTARRKE